MRMRFFFLLPLLALAACAGPAAPPDNYYRIEPAAAPRLAKPVLTGALEVDRLAADGALTERAIAFSAKDGGPLAHYKYDYWSEPPALMIQDRLAAFLTKAGAADRVVTPDLRVLADWSLRGKVRRFEQLADRSMVSIEIQLSVVSARDGTLVLLETYDAQTPTDSDTVTTVAAAMEKGVSDIFARFLADLTRARLK
ncbi:ABC transporter [Paramagnetospirillum kuznetsovii]|uniref:ABC transporter n=1 Tax=Paramagnetospirillum kuznetsovii TaxID=2053833 RepID=A0A364NXD7_9PROT|nr:ABC-type transport auxiliary lipoprotein family protein [Paramagnetospirillum kuznetsovii]RAU21706.1 ABC transporter [Paramagnetospirillum kuznetsovii]